MEVHECPLEVAQVVLWLRHGNETLGDVRVEFQDLQGILTGVGKVTQLQVALAPERVVFVQFHLGAIGKKKVTMTEKDYLKVNRSSSVQPIADALLK